MAAEENEIIKSDEKQLQSLKSELEKLKLMTQHQSAFDSALGSTTSYAGNMENIDPNLQNHINRLMEEKETLLRTGVYSNTDTIIVELDKRIKDCLREAKL